MASQVSEVFILQPNYMNDILFIHGYSTNYGVAHFDCPLNFFTHLISSGKLYRLKKLHIFHPIETVRQCLYLSFDTNISI